MFDTLLHNFIFLATHLVIDAQIITKVDGRELNVRRQSVHSTILYNALFTLHNPVIPFPGRHSPGRVRRQHQPRDDGQPLGRGRGPAQGHAAW